MKLRKNRNAYYINEKFIHLLREWNGYLVVISGPSGVGKSSISEALQLPIIRSVTTREPRQVKESYDFISPEEFYLLRSGNKLATISEYNAGRQYGFTIQSFLQLAEQSKVLCVVLNPMTYKLLKEQYDKVIGLYIYAEKAIVMDRLRKRDGEIIDSKYKSYKANNASISFYHRLVENNDSFKKAVTKAQRAIRKEILIRKFIPKFIRKNIHSVRTYYYQVNKNNKVILPSPKSLRHVRQS